MQVITEILICETLYDQWGACPVNRELTILGGAGRGKARQGKAEARHFFQQQTRREKR